MSPENVPEIRRIAYDPSLGRNSIYVRMKVPMDGYILKMLAEDGYVYSWRPRSRRTPETITIRKPGALWPGKTVMVCSDVDRPNPLIIIPSGNREKAADYFSRYLELYRMKTRMNG